MKKPAFLGVCTGLAALALPQLASHAAESSPVQLAPAEMRQIGTISDRYQSYNVEMLEVTGGKFWKPYDQIEKAHAMDHSAGAGAEKSAGDTPAGMLADLYAYRPPLDLTNPRLRKLAAGLAPAYVRVSGTWANTTYFPDLDSPPASPPAGFGGVLSRQQWKGVVDFAKGVDAQIVTSFATGVGTRDASGVWTPEQAKQFLAYTESIGGNIVAAEFMNEPTIAKMGGAPRNYDAAAYGRDFKVFLAFARASAPKMLVLGPSAMGETEGPGGLENGKLPFIKTRDLLAASGPGVDVFSYHHYGASSLRCAAMGMPGTSAEDALTEEWLRRTDETLAAYRKLRDQFEPGKPFWLTETADTACGGDPWASTFLDSFRYLDQLGRLAKQGVQVVMHNTLVASDYGLLNENTLYPKPNYWSALLWRKLMGTVVLDSGVPIQAGLHVYAHSLRGTPGGVALLVINTDKVAAHQIKLPIAAERYTLSTATSNLQEKHVLLNGAALELGSDDSLPNLSGVPVPAGEITLAPATITFLAIPKAGNSATSK